jgi:23S rRNA pseudoU1915 N3-methylase RlmH
MNDLKFDILSGNTATPTQSELDSIMEKYINHKPPYSKGELAEIRKREANKIKEAEIARKMEQDLKKPIEKEEGPKDQVKAFNEEILEDKKNI